MTERLSAEGRFFCLNLDLLIEMIIIVVPYCI